MHDVHTLEWALECEGFDLDAAMELSANEREDVLSDTFNGDGLTIGGIRLDINSVTAERMGTLETCLTKPERKHGIPTVSINIRKPGDEP